MFDGEGYMEKIVKVSSLAIENVNPTLEEITNFTGSSGGLNSSSNKDLEALVEANLHSEGDFEVGEKVEVLSGELAKMQGVVIAVQNGIVTIKPVEKFGLNVCIAVYYFHRTETTAICRQALEEAI